MKVPKNLLVTLDAIERRLSLFPVLCDEAEEEVDLADLAAVLNEEPLADDGLEALVGAYLEACEFEAARRLLDRSTKFTPAAHEALERRLSDELFRAQAEAESLLQECRERWAEGMSANVVDPKADGAPLEVAETWFKARPNRLRPLLSFLRRLRGGLDRRIADEQRTLVAHLDVLHASALDVVSSADGRKLIEDRRLAVAQALHHREWSVARDGLDELQGVTSDTTALKLPGRPAAGEAWQRAIPSRDAKPAAVDLSALAIEAQAQGEEGRKFLNSWREHRTAKERSGTRTHLGVQWTKWMGFDYPTRVGESDGRPSSADGVVFEFFLKATIPWVADRFGRAQRARYHLLIPNTRRDQQPGALRSTLKHLAEQMLDDGIRVFMYPGVCPPDFRRSSNMPERVAVVDDEDLRRLAACSPDERPRAFLEIVLPQLPVVTATPYHVKNGATPESMFVGRTQELDLLLNRHSAPTIVFSGRCLGKTSLLHQVARRFQAPERKRYAFLKSISTLGDHEVVDNQPPNLGLLELIAEELRGAGFSLPATNPTLEEFKRVMRALMRENPTIELLFLLDEADSFADSERRFGGKGVSWALRDLQSESDDRIRFTFAGYQHVHRVYREKSLAFANWRGLRKLSVLSEEDARRLVRQPMEELGFRFETPTLVGRIVHYTGRHPRLVQVFCDRLCEQVRSRNQHEPFVVLASDIEQVFNDANPNGFVEALRHTLNLNLLEDGRLEFIVYWLVEQAMRGAVSIERFALQTIHAALQAEAGEQLSTDETGTRLLLDELSALGVIESEGSLYRLSNRQHARLLFQAADFKSRRQSAAQKLKERPTRRRVHSATDDVTDIVAQASHEHVCVLGIPGAGDEVLFDAVFSRTNRVVRVECESARSWSDLVARVARACEVSTHDDDLLALLRSWQAREAGDPHTIVLEDVDELVRCERDRLGRTLDGLAEARLGTDLAVRVVLSGGVDLARAFHEDLVLRSTTSVTLSRLETADVETWCRSKGLVVEAELRRRLHDATGGRLTLLEDFRETIAPRVPQGHEEMVVSRADVDGYGLALRDQRRLKLRKRIAGALSVEELRILNYALSYESNEPTWTADNMEDQQLLAMEAGVAHEMVAAVVAVLISLDLLGPPRPGMGGFVRIPNDPLDLLLKG